MDSQKASFQAGETKGQAQEKASGMMEKAGNIAQSVKDSIQDVSHYLLLLFLSHRS
ncbi:unnamed protein product [Linum tenue]|uniref:Uncharacterized protein n=1 Tax=Linum tenue TaxID=586396 RepID=A0AAV0MXY0_9ROSI|nr:unnamed protein product [Linum tenue]